tara:strand:+ start:1333 stop:1617 length:285 start_codon:yes stop_codon:yes gene_type:complete
MLYPLLDNDGAIIANPYINVEVMNLINSATSDEGILCVIDSIGYDMKLDDGVISENEYLYPISLDISIAATAVLERDADGETFLPSTYPSYGGM